MLKRPLFEQWFHDWWESHISLEINILQIEDHIKNLVNKLLIIGDKELAYYQKKNVYSAINGKFFKDFETVQRNGHYKN